MDIEYTTVDRAGWSSGPWDNEPDKVQWRDEDTGMDCLAVRHGSMGHWCGYVGLPSDHALHGIGYDEVHDACEIYVHGGLTFAGHCQPGQADRAICHVAEPGHPDDVWWLGFDCAHFGDYSPRDVLLSARGYPFTIRGDESYRTLSYVKQECRMLARQLAALKSARGEK